MEKTRIEDVDSWMGPAAVKRPLSKALGAENVALNYYELAPGETFGFGYHRHPDPEELFYVVEGVATFETEDGDVTVDAGEAIRFAPGEWQWGRNDSDERVIALALGAPADAGDAEIRRHCPDCGSRQSVHIEATEDRDALLVICDECGAEVAREK